MLHNSYPENFPYGHRGTVLADVIHEMLKFIDGLEVWTQSSGKHSLIIYHQLVQIIRKANNFSN